MRDSLVVLCAFLWPPFIPCPLLPLHPELTLLGMKTSCTCSRFPEACVSGRQISRIVWIIRNTRFPETRWAEQHPEFVLLCSQVHTWEYLVLTRLLRVTRRIFVPQIRYATRRDNMRLLSPMAMQYGILSFRCNVLFMNSFRHWLSFVFWINVLQQYNWILYLLQIPWLFLLLELRFPLCLFGNTVFCMA